MQKIVRLIPVQQVFNCFEMEYPSFLSRSNGPNLQKGSHINYLEKLYAKYQKWNDKYYSKTLPGFLSIPIQVLKKFFQNQLQGEHLYLKVYDIDDDGNCLYQALSESRFVIDYVPKFKSYLSMERYKYVREIMYNFAKTNQKLCFMIWKH
jgi:hypothetical protein